VKVISSGQTFFIKKIFPVVWLGFIAVFFVTGLISGGIKQDPVFLIMPLIMIAFGALLFKHLVWDLADEVKDAGDYLIVRKGGIEERISLQDIMNISMSTATNPPRLSLRLRKVCKFGDEVVFSPARNFSFNPFAKNAIAEDLIVRVDRARASR